MYVLAMYVFVCKRLKRGVSLKLTDCTHKSPIRDPILSKIVQGRRFRHYQINESVHCGREKNEQSKTKETVVGASKSHSTHCAVVRQWGENADRQSYHL